MTLSERLKIGIKILEHWQACSWVIDQKAILQCCDPGVGICDLLPQNERKVARLHIEI